MGARAFEHFYISLAGSILGAGIGVGIGFILDRLSPGYRNGITTVKLSRILIPWRTLLVFLLMVNYYPIYLVISFGLHSIVGIISIAYFTMICLVPLTMQVMAQKRAKHPPEIFGYVLIRSLGVFTPVLATHYGQFSFSLRPDTFGLGELFKSKISSLEYGEAFLIVLAIIGVSLLIDLISGYYEYRIWMKMNKRDPVSLARFT